MKLKIITAIMIAVALCCCSSAPSGVKKINSLCEKTLSKLDTVSSFASLRQINWDFGIDLEQGYAEATINSKDENEKKELETMMQNIEKVYARFGELQQKFTPTK